MECAIIGTGRESRQAWWKYCSSFASYEYRISAATEL